MWDSGGGCIQGSRLAPGLGAPAGLADSGQWARGTAPLVHGAWRKAGGVPSPPGRHPSPPQREPLRLLSQGPVTK